MRLPRSKPLGERDSSASANLWITPVGRSVMGGWAASAWPVMPGRARSKRKMGWSPSKLGTIPGPLKV
ncbi:hypothetical protein NL428_28090, partial [Klebsiella pneumoniae]|nr:hypothetical protein [Klebsiella pneumoniae]